MTVYSAGLERHKCVLSIELTIVMLSTRIIAARRLPSTLVASRHLSSNTRGEGSVATSKGFGCVSLVVLLIAADNVI